jgi:hypothetical protein
MARCRMNLHVLACGGRYAARSAGGSIVSHLWHGVCSVALPGVRRTVCARTTTSSVTRGVGNSRHPLARSADCRRRLAEARALGAALLAGLVAIAFAAGNQPLEYLDEQTGATVLVVSRPLVFVRAHSAFAGNSGEYVTLAAAEVDQSGRISDVLLVYRWSLGAARGTDTDGSGTPARAVTLVLQADDQRIALEQAGRPARELGIGVRVHAPPFGAAPPAIYAVELPALRLIAASHRLSLRVQEEGAALDYELFDDRRVALREFIGRVNGGDGSDGRSDTAAAK